MADSPILDYYRGSDLGCQLRRIGENYIEDTYAIGMSKGFPLKDSISALIAKYSSNGYLDILVEKWYGGLVRQSEGVLTKPLLLIIVITFINFSPGCRAIAMKITLRLFSRGRLALPLWPGCIWCWVSAWFLGFWFWSLSTYSSSITCQSFAISRRDLFGEAEI